MYTPSTRLLLTIRITISVFYEYPLLAQGATCAVTLHDFSDYNSGLVHGHLPLLHADTLHLHLILPMHLPQAPCMSTPHNFLAWLPFTTSTCSDTL